MLCDIVNAERCDMNIMKFRLPQTGKIFECIGRKVDVIIFEQGLRINSHGYMKPLKTVDKLWLERVAAHWT